LIWVGAYFVVPEFFLKRAKMSGAEPYLIVQPETAEPGANNQQALEYRDIHAGGSETSLMIKDFPELVDIELARSLKSSRTTAEGLKTWVKGGEPARAVTPLGYCGDPSAIDMEATKIVERELTEDIPRIIYDFLKAKK
jgi:creatinine amidohydrolase